MLGGTILDDGHVEMNKSRPCSKKTNNYPIYQKFTECPLCTIYSINC